MKRRLILTLSAAFILLGCGVRATLYPVQGPLSKQNPPITFAAKVKGFNGPGREITVDFSGGEVLSGSWELVRGARDSKGAPPVNASAADSLSAEWDAVYGPGYYSGHILGKTYERAVLHGNQGTVMTLELYQHEDIRGVARDNHDNVFKVVVY